MTEFVSGVMQDPLEWHEKQESARQEKESAAYARRAMTARLHNFGSWYRKNHSSEIDRDSGQIKVNALHRLRKMYGSLNKSYTSTEDLPDEINEEDAVEVYEAIKMLVNVNHIVIIQYRFQDSRTVKDIAEHWGKSEKTVNRLQQAAIDELIKVI